LIQQKQLAAYEHDGFFAAMDTFKDKQTLDTLNETGEAPWEVWRTNERRMQKAAKAFASNSGTVAAPATAATPRPI
jgi:glucose-1-phosphate cytidylyltransferase